MFRENGRRAAEKEGDPSPCSSGPPLPPSHPLTFNLDPTSPHLNSWSSNLSCPADTVKWQTENGQGGGGQGGAQCLLCRLKAAGPQPLGAGCVLCEVGLIMSASKAVWLKNTFSPTHCLAVSFSFFREACPSPPSLPTPRPKRRDLFCLVP